jgi:DUF1680 family protein
MCVELLKMTGDPVVADELELSLFNAGLFLLSASGRWCVYTSPMAGVRESTTLEIGAAQNKRAASDLSCCAVNGPRIVGLPADWGMMAIGGHAEGPGFAVNLYAAGSVTAPFAAPVRGSLTLRQTTTYPADGRITIAVHPDAASPSSFGLWLRVPCWSERTVARLNGALLPPPIAGQCA